MACQPLCRFPSPLIVAPMRPTLMAGGMHLLRLRHESSSRRVIRCINSTPCPEASVPRRSANYQPTLWPDSFIQTLTSDYYTGDAEIMKVEELKRQVSRLISDVDGTVPKLELLDVVRRLGVEYHFDQEIEVVLRGMSTNLEGILRELEGDLLHTSLLFRLLREHGFAVSQDVFHSFKDGKGNFKRTVPEDVEGILSLYEASYLAMDGERTLDEARAFAVNYLNGLLLGGNVEDKLREKVEYALDVPLHWRVPRLYARWFIDVYKREAKACPTLLELAKLDFNMVQRVHNRDVKAMSRWWEDIGLGKLHFARDRLMECFLWSLGLSFAPQFWLCRRGITQVIALITSIDDSYDVYGTLEELEAFTEVVERWDLNAMEKLPNYMKPIFQVLFNTTNDLAGQCFRRNGFNCLSYLKKEWTKLCKCFLLEANWYYSGHNPTLKEYLDHGWTAVGSFVVLIHVFFLMTENVTREHLECIENSGDLIKWPSMLLRLTDDLGTSKAEMERGDVLKSVQLYMHESNASEAMARDHIKALISDAWKKANKELIFNKDFQLPIIKGLMNLGRIAQRFYQNGDGHGAPEEEFKNLVKLLLVEPIH